MGVVGREEREVGFLGYLCKILILIVGFRFVGRGVFRFVGKLDMVEDIGLFAGLYFFFVVYFFVCFFVVG